MQRFGEGKAHLGLDGRSLLRLTGRAAPPVAGEGVVLQNHDGDEEEVE